MRTLVPSFLGHNTLVDALPGCNDLSPSLSMTIQNYAPVQALPYPIDVMSIDSGEKFEILDTSKKARIHVFWSTLARFRVASNERMQQKTRFRDCIIYYWTH